MLRALQIRHLALIESLDLQLEEDFTCLTGETGAGKSILLDAVGLLLGVRASSDLVRQGAPSATVEGMFEISQQVRNVLADFCEEHGIFLEDDQLVLYREVSVTGKTIARINGRLVTNQLLREIGRYLIHQYGQNDSIVLQKKEEHLHLLDRYGAKEIDPIKTAYQSTYQRYQEAKQELARALQNETTRARRIDELTYQLQEIRQAKLKNGEEERLRVLRSRYQNAERLRSAVDQVYVTLEEGAGRSSINALLYTIETQVKNVESDDPSLSTLSELLETARVNLQEATLFVSHYRDEIDYDPLKLEKVEDRLALLERLYRKYGATIDEVLSYEQKAAQEIDELLHHDEWLTNKQEVVKQLEEEVTSLANQLSEVRQAMAMQIEKALLAVFDRLMMPHVTLAMQFQKTTFRRDGVDDFEILLSANPGEKVKPLAKIASGGELSRIMLAFATILAGDSVVPTLIFDEIDTGISGRAAQAVAHVMADIAKNVQLLCVTHLPQMASFASHHLFIEKIVEDNRTKTIVTSLDEEARVRELARMIHGEAISEQALANAKEMLLVRSHPVVN